MIDVAVIRAEWANRITEAWRKSFAQIIETARLHIDAKAGLPRDEFLAWIHGAAPVPPLWIASGCRERLTYPTDVERFTAHPVLTTPCREGARTMDQAATPTSSAPGSALPPTNPATPSHPQTPRGFRADWQLGVDIPACLRRATRAK